MKIRDSFYLFLAIFIQSFVAQGEVPPWIDTMYKKMRAENHELRASGLNQEYTGVEVEAARSYLSPGLSMNLAFNEGKEKSLNSSTANSLLGGSSAASGALSGVSYDNPSVSSSSGGNSKGYAGQLSATYVLFSGFIISENIRRANIGYEKAQLSDQSLFNQKRSQLLQALLEWQWIKSSERPIKEAQKVVGRVRENSNKKLAKLLFGEIDNAEVSEKQKNIKLYDVKVTQGLKFVEGLIDFLVPGTNFTDLQNKKIIRIQYDIPNEEFLLKKYRDSSLGAKLANLDIATAESMVHVSRWQKPYIPTVALSLNASRTTSLGSSPGTYDDWSAALMFNFNLYDGGLSSSRRRQALIAKDFMERKKRWEEEKALLVVQHQLMEVKVNEAEYQQKMAVVKRKAIQLDDVKNKLKNGIATETELSGAKLELAKARIEGLETLKKYYSALLGIAVELNEIDKIKIVETEEEI